MFYYAQIDEKNICIGISQLSGEVMAENMITIDNEEADLLGRKYDNGVWEDVAQPEPTPEPTEEEIVQAEMLLNQQKVINRQNEQDVVLAELLLNQQGV